MRSTPTVKEMREQAYLMRAMNLIKPAPQFVLLRKNILAKVYRAALPMGHRLEGEPFIFLNEMISSTTALIDEELNRSGGLTFTLTLVAEMKNNNNLNVITFSLEQRHSQSTMKARLSKSFMKL